MIGVISKKNEAEIVKEFFQLFKVPWEFFNSNRSYDVILSTQNEIPELSAKLVVIYSSEAGKLDSDKGITTGFHSSTLTLECDDIEFPIYGNILTFEAVCEPLITVKGTGEAAGIEMKGKGQKLLRIGFDIFQEIYFLLSSGQPPKYAHIPTFEIHISLLRNWILQSGIPLVEIPPTPAGYDFIVCLTHDVDFVGIRNHRFDHTMFGFIYRALLGSFLGVIKGRTSWKKLLRNWKAVLLLPGVYLGIVEDFWFQFDRYMEIEKDLWSTFFFIPFKNRAGINTSGPVAKRRAARYDVTDIKPEVQRLVSRGFEVGLHGIDSWQDSKKGREEFDRISNAIGQSNIGVRMHWLYFCNRSPQIIENAGFSYDSTFGYNDAVGYRGGTTQVFRPPGAKRLLELPLHIQDTALFYPKRMDLAETKALDLVNKLLKNAIMYGGVLTINWHHRSLGPERLWDDFYIRLIDKINKQRSWFGNASEIVEWFQKRRQVTFEDIQRSGKKIRIVFGNSEKEIQLPMIIRVHRPAIMKSRASALSEYGKNYTELLWNGKRSIEISI